MPPPMQHINHIISSSSSSSSQAEDEQQNRAIAHVNNDIHYSYASTSSPRGPRKCGNSKNYNDQNVSSHTTTLFRSSRRRIRRRRRRGVLQRPDHLPLITAIVVLIIKLLLLLTCAVQSGLASSSTRMVRLCIASVDPVKLSSQCVMCNRRDFPLTVIDCTGITKVNDLIANPLSVREATCLIYNCRRQVPDIKPEPYHGSVSHAANYHRGGGGGTTSGLNGYPITASGSQLYEMSPTSGLLPTGGYNSLVGHGAGDGSGSPYAPGLGPLLAGSPGSAYMSRYGLANFRANHMQGIGTALTPISSMGVPRGLIGGPSLMPYRPHQHQSQHQHQHQHQQALPYALVPAPSTFLFGSRKYKAALVPLFK